MSIGKIFITMFLAGTFLSGCATKVERTQPLFEEAQTIVRLQCKAVNRLGCRYKGRIYPWNAWVEMKGYKSIDYEVTEVIQSGNQATVLVVNR